MFDDTIGVRRPDRLDALEQRLLDVELLDDRFDDPVGVDSCGEVVIEAAGGDERGRVAA